MLRVAIIHVIPPQRYHRHEQQKVSSDFQKALQSFQQAQKRSAERQRLFVERAKASIQTEWPFALSSGNE